MSRPTRCGSSAAFLLVGLHHFDFVLRLQSRSHLRALRRSHLHLEIRFFDKWAFCGGLDRKTFVARPKNFV